MRYLGVAMILLALSGAIVLADSLLVFFDLPGLLFVVLVGSGILFATYGNWVRVLLDSRQNESNPEMVQEVARTGMQAFIASGWLGVLIGIIQMLAALEDPQQLGRATALALLTAFYGHAIAYACFMPLSRKGRHAKQHTHSPVLQ